LFKIVNNQEMSQITPAHAWAKRKAWWGHLHWLAVLHDQGGFSAAANQLGVSKAAVSQRMTELEAAVGTPLIQRTTRRVHLTETGRRLVEDTREAFAHIADTLARAKDSADEPRGLVRVSAPVALTRQQLVPLMPGFLARYPGIRVQLDLSDRLVNVVGDGFDLAVRHVATPPDTLVARLLCSSRTVLVAAPTYLERARIRQPADLAQHACLAYPRTSGQTVWRFVSRDKRRRSEAVSVGGPLAVNNSEALRDAAEAGLGLALLPDFSAQAGLRSGALQEVLPQWEAHGVFAPTVYALRPYTPHVPRAVRLLIDHLAERLAEGFAV
jgi:DNA-binding transcriptional LysR family regulator